MVGGTIVGDEDELPVCHVLVIPADFKTISYEERLSFGSPCLSVNPQCPSVQQRIKNLHREHGDTTELHRGLLSQPHFNKRISTYLNLDPFVAKKTR